MSLHPRCSQRSAFAPLFGSHAKWRCQIGWVIAWVLGQCSHHIPSERKQPRVQKTDMKDLGSGTYLSYMYRGRAYNIQLFKFGKGPQVAEREFFRIFLHLSSFCNDVTRKHRLGNATVRFSFNFLQDVDQRTKFPFAVGFHQRGKHRWNCHSLFAEPCLHLYLNSLIYCLFFLSCAAGRRGDDGVSFLHVASLMCRWVLISWCTMIFIAVKGRLVSSSDIFSTIKRMFQNSDSNLQSKGFFWYPYRVLLVEDYK